MIRRITYGVFGNVRTNLRPGPPTTLDPAHKYTGQQLDDDTGLTYYGARWYDATYGVFTSADPVVPDPLDPQSLNRYAYVRGDPLRATDPSGNYPIGGYDPYDDWGWGGSGFGFGGSSLSGGSSLFDSSWSFQISSWSFSNWHLFDSSSSRGSSSASKMLFESAYYAEYDRDRERESQSGGGLTAGDCIAAAVVAGAIASPFEGPFGDIAAIGAAGSRAAKVAAALGIPLAITSDQGPRDPIAVRLQAQGGGLEQSVLINSGPGGIVTATDGLTGLTKLQGLLTPGDLQARTRSFQRASRFITGAAAGGGFGPGAVSFPAGPRTDVRVDIEVLRGRAFIPGPRSDALIR